MTTFPEASVAPRVATYYCKIAKINKQCQVNMLQITVVCYTNTAGQYCKQTATKHTKIK